MWNLFSKREWLVYAVAGVAISIVWWAATLFGTLVIFELNVDRVAGKAYQDGRRAGESIGRTKFEGKPFALVPGEYYVLGCIKPEKDCQGYVATPVCLMIRLDEPGSKPKLYDMSAIEDFPKERDIWCFPEACPFPGILPEPPLP